MEELKEVKNESAKIEAEANYEGNDSLILFNRLHDPLIRKQLIDLYAKVESSHIKTREELEKKFDDRISEMEEKTGIDYSNNDPHASHLGVVIPLNWCDLFTGEKPTSKQLAAIEAHEKGHYIRFVDGYMQPFLSAYFSRAIDLQSISLPEKYEKWLTKYAEEAGKTREEIIENYFEYLMYPQEIAERMSQLKNYFGMSGSDIFTLDHLNYARGHYVEDTGCDNGMSIFLQGITPEREEDFLEIINSSGI